MKLALFGANRTGGEIAAALAMAALIVGIAVFMWHELPTPGSSGRLVQNALSIPFLYKLANSGDGKRNLTLHTVLWLTPVLLIQLVFQGLVMSGVGKLD